ncbi:MAG: MarR family winged helix-turn-helix transcriptional regulator [Pseudomonadota bacterium]|nr:MarR family winged helix-turn-helix transcriptional regulator [Pseudomonadota bacterium]
MTRPDDERLSPPTLKRDGLTILDIRNYAPFLMNAVSNGWQRRTSPIYRQTFDISILDWRVIAMLNIEPDISGQRICEVVRLDKAAVSRSLNFLAERGYVEYSANESDPRRRAWRLTAAGLEVHDKCLEIALENEEALFKDVAPENLEVFLRVMRQILRNLDD